MWLMNTGKSKFKEPKSTCLESFQKRRQASVARVG